MKKHFTFIILLLISLNMQAQNIKRTSSTTVTGAVCSTVIHTYEVENIPANLSKCKIRFVVPSGGGGRITQDPNDQRKASVIWNDTPGAKAILKAVFETCDPARSPNPETPALEELILSVKGQAWGSFESSTSSISFCNTREVTLTMPEMIVKGTGINNPVARTEVRYIWTLPAGWRGSWSASATGAVSTTLPSITIVPTGCAIRGIVKVEGTIASICGTGTGLSAAANITLNSDVVSVNISAQAGFAGTKACDRTRVTFYATPSPSNVTSCITGYSWNIPPSWTNPTYAGNSVTLTPSGTEADKAEIKGTVVFSCGSSVSGSITPGYIEPLINGPDVVCSTGDFTIQRASSAGVVWSSSNTNILTIDPHSGKATRVGTTPGSVTRTGTM
jgi:hypothetical protein